MEFIYPDIPLHTSGTYKIVFDDKWFYVGSSRNLRSRFATWRTILREPKGLKNKNIKTILPSISIVRFEIVRQYASRRHIRDAENRLLKKYWDDEQLLNRCPDAYSPKNMRRYFGQKPKPVHRPLETLRQKVAQFDSEGELIAIHKSINDAARHIGVQARRIDEVFKGKKKKVKGFVLKRVSTDGTFIENIIPPKKVRKKQELKPWRKFYQIDMNGTTIAEFVNLSVAAKAVGGSGRNIIRVLRGDPNYKTVKGFFFKFADALPSPCLNGEGAAKN